MAIGYYFGRAAENKHFKSIRKREKKYRNLPAVTFKSLPPEQPKPTDSKLVIGSTVVSIDYFKRFLGMIGNIFGGNLSSYESLIDRGRRESLLRMKKAAKDADMIINIRIETSMIGQSANQKGSVGSIEVLAYGTAVKF